MAKKAGFGPLKVKQQESLEAFYLVEIRTGTGTAIVALYVPAYCHYGRTTTRHQQHISSAPEKVDKLQRSILTYEYSHAL